MKWLIEKEINNCGKLINKCELIWKDQSDSIFSMTINNKPIIIPIQRLLFVNTLITGEKKSDRVTKEYLSNHKDADLAKKEKKPVPTFTLDSKE
ncbi:hypothetical protein AYI69_g7058 [Smittium culicis]|uniref:Uncharacterized protein n=1 Tax=Smittium culicis TaxID=133412 RepID=A0A1R1XUS2_9FUNG|nr:hypothetical protein AYI69_g7058 [Smittium culicis]